MPTVVRTDDTRRQSGWRVRIIIERLWRHLGQTITGNEKGVTFTHLLAYCQRGKRMTVLAEKEAPGVDDLPTDEEVMAELSSAFEDQLQVKPPPSPSALASSSSSSLLSKNANTPHTYEDWKLEVDRGLVLRLLDSNASTSGAGLREDARTEVRFSNGAPIEYSLGTHNGTHYYSCVPVLLP
jgi:hypothetical protein